MQHIKSIKIDTLTVHPKVGNNLINCQKASLELAAREWCNVNLVFGDDTYRIEIKKMIEMIEKD